MKITQGYTTHNKAKLIRGGKDYFELLEKIIEEAKHSIHFQTYIFDADATGTKVTQALIRAARRGVNVYLLVDGFASQDLPDTFIQELYAAGINFRWFGPILKNRYLYFGRRLHHKVVVADAYRCVIGGLNISDRYNDLPGHPAWLDWAIYAEGEVARDAFEICSRRALSRWVPWNKRSLIPPKLHNPPPDICRLRVRVNDWVLGRREISRSYIQMLRHASREVIILSSYFLPGQEFRRALRQATKRGVKVSVIQAGVSDIKLAKQAERYLYAWLLRHRISVYEYSPNVLHGKIACCDYKWITVGSYNINDLSARASVELNVEAEDERLSSQVHNALEEIIRNDCRQITPEVEKKATLIDRVTQKFAYIVSRLFLLVFTFYFRQQKR